eukprot:4987919-Prymnesium_polylepis.1
MEDEENNSSELAFDEFCEIIARVCNEKVPHAMDHFAETLDDWLGLIFLPTAKSALKGLKEKGGRA